MRNTKNMIITCSLAFIPHELLIRIKYCLIHTQWRRNTPSKQSFGGVSHWSQTMPAPPPPHPPKPLSPQSVPVPLYTLIELRALGRNFYIAAGWDLNVKAIFKNNDKLWNNGLWLCIKTTPNKIVHYSAIFTVNINKLSFRLFELFTIKSVKSLFNT